MKRILALFLILLLAAGCAAPGQAPGASEEPSVPEIPAVPEEPVIPDEPAVPETATVILCYPDKEFLELRKEYRTITLTEKGAEWDALEALYAGPQQEDLTAVIAGTAADILSVQTENGRCTVDLSQNFVLQNTGGSTREGFVLSSIVQALCSLDGIEEVKFNVEGNATAEYGGHFTLDEPFRPAG